MSTYYLKDINEIDYKKLENNDHLIILDNEDNKFINTRHMVLTHKSGNIFYIFHVHYTKIEKNKAEFRCGIQTKENVELYVVCKNKLVQLKNKKYHTDPFNILYFDKKPNIISEIIINSFSGSNGINPIYGKINKNNTTIPFLSIPIDEENNVVFVYKHTLNPSAFKWKISKDIYLLNRFNSKYYIKINAEFEDFMNLIIEEMDLDLEKYPQINECVFISNYDIQDHLKCNDQEKIVNIQKIYDFFSFNTAIDLNSIIYFFNPIYENKSSKLTVYMNTIKNNPNNYIFYVKGKKINDPIIFNQEEIRIVDSIYKYVSNSNTGINPYDGNYYVGGKLANAPRIIKYKDSEGVIIISNTRSYKYFIKINEFFIEGDRSRDANLINDLKHRAEVLKKLSAKGEN